MRRPEDYANHGARARTIAWALDLALSPMIGVPLEHEPTGARILPGSGNAGASVGGVKGGVFRVAAPSGSSERPLRILLIRPDHAGDLLMATPAIRALRRAHPGATIDLLASPWGAPALAGNPDLDRVLTIEATWFEPGRREGPDPSRLIGSVLALRFPEESSTSRFTPRTRRRAGRYDAAADLRGDFRSILLARASGARVRAGFSRVGLERILTDALPLDPRMDHVSRNHAVARLLGAGPLEARRPVFIVPAGADAEARALLSSLPRDRPIVVVHPGTNRPWASWGVEKFAEAIGALAARRPIAVVADGRGADREAASRVAAVAASRGAAAIDLSGRTSFAEAAAILRASSVLLANDSGAAHLAVAVGTPVAAIFGPTDPALFWTWDDPDRYVAVAAHSECPRPCFRSHCPRDHGYGRIAPADVAALLDRLIDDSRPSGEAGGPGASRTVSGASGETSGVFGEGRTHPFVSAAPSAPSDCAPSARAHSDGPLSDRSCAAAPPLPVAASRPGRAGRGPFSAEEPA